MLDFPSPSLPALCSAAHIWIIEVAVSVAWPLSCPACNTLYTENRQRDLNIPPQLLGWKYGLLLILLVVVLLIVVVVLQTLQKDSDRQHILRAALCSTVHLIYLYVFLTVTCASEPLSTRHHCCDCYCLFSSHFTPIKSFSTDLWVFSWKEIMQGEKG